MDTRHQPVLLQEALELLRPGPEKVLLDLTLGGGGYSSALLERGCRVIALDRDAAALERARARLHAHGAAFNALQQDFARFGETLDLLRVPAVDGICMDLGMSSDQLDDPQRGFAFRLEGPLDLRFDRSTGRPAWELLSASERPVVEGWLRDLGEVRRAARIARELTGRARAGQLRTTAHARAAVEACLPRVERPEPELARVFQALRIMVNGELEQLDSALGQVADRLRAGGRFVAVSYHSLEDRRVKRLLSLESGKVEGSRHLPAPQARAPRLRVLTRRPVRPGADEIHRNPRARSARLRAGERIP